MKTEYRKKNGNMFIWGQPARGLRARYTTLGDREKESLLLISNLFIIYPITFSIFLLSLSY